GHLDGRIAFYRNEGSASAPFFTARPMPTDTIDVNRNAAPVFVDIDGDGDPDLVVGRGNGHLRFYRNVLNASVFGPVLDTTYFGAVAVGEDAYPAFVDIDGDGDEDLFVGNAAGDIYYY